MVVSVSICCIWNYANKLRWTHTFRVQCTNTYCIADCHWHMMTACGSHGCSADPGHSWLAQRSLPVHRRWGNQYMFSIHVSKVNKYCVWISNFRKQRLVNAQCQKNQCTLVDQYNSENINTCTLDSLSSSDLSVVVAMCSSVSRCFALLWTAQACTPFSQHNSTNCRLPHIDPREEREGGLYMIRKVHLPCSYLLHWTRCFYII